MIRLCWLDSAVNSVIACPAVNCVPVTICGESDVELWIDYSFAIESIKEMSRPRK
jgi:hypothetical protein